MKKILLTIIIIFLALFIIYKQPTQKNENLTDILNNIASSSEITEYYIYGNHLNIKGTIQDTNINKLEIVLKNNTTETSIIEVSHEEKDNKTTYNTSTYLNEGINLDTLNTGNYILLLKATNEETTTYYNLINKTKYNDLIYYTTTKENNNNEILISFKEHNAILYTSMSITSKKLDNLYYDIVIDPGHGGDDPGTSYNKDTEAVIVLDYAKALKQELEKLGLKVILTRDQEFPNTYGYNSRTGIPYETKAKYTLSLHLNSTEEKLKNGGIEIYTPNNIDYTFAKKMASNIVNIASTSYSKNEDNKIDKGVYFKEFKTKDITEMNNTASTKGYKAYNIKKNTPYYFIIRETGGYMTHSYIDGRDKTKDKNPYYNSNTGSETYLIELGYINFYKDLNNLKNNKSAYINALVQSVKEELQL